MRSLDVGVVLHGPQAEVLQWNQAALALLGLTEGQLAERESLDPGWTVIHLDGSEYLADAMPLTKVLETGQAVENAIMGVWRPTSTDRVWLLGNATPMFDSDGELEAVLCSFSDISDQILLEKRRGRLMRAAVLSKMTAGIVHDVKNLLASIQAYSDLAKLQLGVSDPIIESLHGIDGVVEQGARLSEQLLSFVVERQGPQEVINLNSVIVEMAGMVRSLMGDPISVNFDLSEREVIVRAGVTEIQQVLLNLTVNARDAMSRGGELRIRTRHAKNERGEPQCLLEVTDTGCGISEAILPHIFDVYFSSRVDGTGLGLATTRDIARQLGGTVKVESTLGDGSTFVLAIPQAEADSTRRAAIPAANDAEARGSERILLVEDNPGIRHLTAGMLSSLGYQVQSCASGSAALEVLSKENFSLLISDLLMPGMDGIKLAESLANQGKTIPMILCTAESMESDPRLARVAFPILWKPYRYSALARTVRSTIDNNK